MIRQKMQSSFIGRSSADSRRKPAESQKGETPLRAILIDFDGTLADTETLHGRAFLEVLGRRGVRLTEREYAERYLGRGTDRDAVAQALEDAARPDLRGDVEAIVREKAERMRELLAGPVPLFDGARAFLDEASRVGPLAVVSGALRSEVVGMLERHAILDRFVAVVTAEDVRRGKPDPEGYELGLRRLRERLADLAARECLAVEDSALGVAAARAAGMRTLALAHTRPASELRAADVVAASFAAVDWSALRALR